MRAEALKMQATTSRPIKALTVYPPNTPVTLVPRVLPTKSQALTKEIKEMKDIFEELEAEVDQNSVDRKHDEIERKNLLIANDNLIVDCLSKEVFYVATNSELNVSSFTEMHDAHTSLKARCLELEVELSDLRDKIQKDNHNELIKRFSNLKVNHLNLQLKYQNLKESFGNNTSPPARDVPDFDSVFVIEKMKASIQGKDNAIKKLRMQISQLKEPIVKAENGKIKQHYKEFYDSIKITRVNTCTDASRSQPRSYTKKNRILPAESVNMKKVEEHPRTIKSSLKTTNRVDSSISSKHTIINSNSHSVCQTCNKCLISANHDMCVVTYLHSVNASSSVKNVVRKVKQVWKLKQVKQVWKPTGDTLTTVGYQWMPTGRTFTLGEQCPLTRLTKPNKVSAIAYANLREPNHNWGSNFPNSPSLSIFKCRNFVKKFIGTVGFGNDHFGAIKGCGDYVIGESVISGVYYVEGLGHNLYSVGQFCDSDLEVAFRKHSCYVRDTDGVELIKGSRGSNLFTISIEDMLKSSPICLLSKASKNKSWLWHRRLNHLKFEKDHLCSACQLGKSKKHTHKPKTENTNLEFFRSKDETPKVVIKFLKQIQVGLNKTVRNIHTDNGTEFVNKDLSDYYERVSIFHQKTFPRTPQQNGEEVVATAYYTQSRSLIHTRHCKTPYELVHDKKPDLTFFRVFGALCYPINDSEDLGKLQPTR
ncbi:retrovirus-related pol polyprotein from transposon TNT 1-94 [Tanacetum coccineum]